MSKLGEEILQGLREAVAHMRGEIALPMRRVPVPERVKRRATTGVINLRIDELLGGSDIDRNAYEQQREVLEAEGRIRDRVRGQGA